MAIDPGDFEYIKKFVYGGSAIVLEAEKEYLLVSRLEPLAKSEGLSSISDLVATLRKQLKNSPLHRKVINAMTTNETSFFRDIHPFEALRNNVLPDIIQQKNSTKTLTIWCAAASTGQEPYTIAMVLRTYFPELINWKIYFLATDICTDVLAKAKEGLFTQLEVNRGLPASFLVKYFTKQGVNWQVSDELRKMITFAELNLAEAWVTMPVLDIVFIRNVLIYFDAETKKVILGKIRRILSPTGYLFLGGAETTLNLDSSFERIQLDKTSCYRIIK